MSATPDSPEVTTPPEKVVVLLVDDQKMIGEVVRRLLLEQRHIEYHFCLEAEKAVERANAVLPDVILQDLVMPGLSGLDLVRRYRENLATAETPIIILSAADEGDVQNELTLAGATDFMVKLPEKGDLVSRIHRHTRDRAR